METGKNENIMYCETLIKYEGPLSSCATKIPHCHDMTWSMNVQISQIMLISEFYSAKHGVQGRIQDLIKGGAPDRSPKLPMVHSSVVRVKRALFSMGSGARLRAPEALEDSSLSRYDKLGQ